MTMSEFGCPTPTKVAYRSYEEARATAMRQPVLWSPVAVYACRCGRWHGRSSGAIARSSLSTVLVGRPGVPIPERHPHKKDDCEQQDQRDDVSSTAIGF